VQAIRNLAKTPPARASLAHSFFTIFSKKIPSSYCVGKERAIRVRAANYLMKQSVAENGTSEQNVARCCRSINVRYSSPSSHKTVYSTMLALLQSSKRRIKSRPPKKNRRVESFVRDTPIPEGASRTQARCSTKRRRRLPCQIAPRCY
jgi:hypothetical protein